VTRDSVLKLAPTLGYEVEERLFDVNDLMADIKAGKVTEAFGSGTAAVITPVCKLCYKNETQQLSGGSVGEITQQLYDTLTGIQTGTLEESFGWVRSV
jgi:branched-chain amino acid aminotransferase